MSNTKHTDPAAPIRGDFGIGLCLACVRDHITAAMGAAKGNGGRPAGLPPQPPQFAIVMAPSPVPVPGPNGEIMGYGMVTLPSCYDHLSMTRPGAPRSGLILP